MEINFEQREVRSKSQNGGLTEVRFMPRLWEDNRYEHLRCHVFVNEISPLMNGYGDDDTLFSQITLETYKK